MTIVRSPSFVLSGTLAFACMLPATAGAAREASAGGAPVASASQPVVRIESKQLAIEGGRARFRLACETATCTGAIALVAKLTVRSRDGERPKIAQESVVLAKGSYTLAEGSAKAVVFKLTAQGRTLLARAAEHRARSRYREPPARATITVTVTSGVAQSKTLKIVRVEQISGNFTLTPAS